MPPGSQTISPDVAFESPHDQKPDRVRTGVSTIRERRSVRERVGWRGLSRYLRRILVVGAHSVLRQPRIFLRVLPGPPQHGMRPDHKNAPQVTAEEAVRWENETGSVRFMNCK